MVQRLIGQSQNAPEWRTLLHYCNLFYINQFSHFRFPCAFGVSFVSQRQKAMESVAQMGWASVSHCSCRACVRWEGLEEGGRRISAQNCESGIYQVTFAGE